MITTTQQEFRLRSVFNPAAVELLGRNIARVWPSFGWVYCDHQQFATLSFGGRNGLIHDTLRVYLPQVNYITDRDRHGFLACLKSGLRRRARRTFRSSAKFAAASPDAYKWLLLDTKRVDATIQPP